MDYIFIPNQQNRYQGQLGGGTRRVTITGTMTYNEPFWRTLAGVRSDLIERFAQRAGWNIVNLDLVPYGSWTGFQSVPAGFNLTADVPDDYSNADHLAQAYAILNAYSITALSTVYVFTNLSLQITGADRANYVPQPTTTIVGTPTPRPRSNAGGNSAGNYIPTPEEIAAAIQAAGDDAADKATDLFGVTGLSIGAIAALLAVVIILRK